MSGEKRIDRQIKFVVVVVIIVVVVVVIYNDENSVF